MLFSELTRRLVLSSTIVKEKLDAENIRYLEPEGGLFIIVDLRSYLKDNTFEEEKALFEHLLYKHKIYINFGQSFGFSDPGFFRVIFSRLTPTMEEAVHRIANGLNAY